MFKPYPLETGTAVAVIVGNRPVSVDPFQHGNTILESATIQGRFQVKMTEIQCIRWSAIVGGRRQVHRSWRSIFMTKNILIVTIAQGRGERIEKFKGAITVIAGTGMPDPGSHCLADLTAGKRVG